jgi:hypothetical protein
MDRQRSSGPFGGEILPGGFSVLAQRKTSACDSEDAAQRHLSGIGGMELKGHEFGRVPHI